MRKNKRLLSVLLATVMLLSSVSVFTALSADAPEKNKSDEIFVFVHGLNGWGENEGINTIMPYWGATTGDLVAYLNGNGYKCYSASVGPISSAWDRACELYAQLFGTTVDYGVAHSEKNGHLRYGRTYEEPLIKDWGKDGYQAINLIGHSYGGATIRLFTYLLCNGSDEERAATAENDICGLFTGGKKEWIKSVTTICTPHNSSTVFYPLEKVGLDDFIQRFSIMYAGIAGRSSLNGTYFDFHLEQFGLTNTPGSSDADNYLYAVSNLMKHTNDSAQYGCTPAGAKELNDMLDVQDGIYYFSYAFSSTYHVPGLNIELPIFSTNPMLFAFTLIMGVTRKYYDKELDITYDSSWEANDGLVNTVSALYPFDEAHTEFNADSIHKGIWNVMPVQRGDHGTAIGILADESDTHSFYNELITLLSGLPE